MSDVPATEDRQEVQSRVSLGTVLWGIRKHFLLAVAILLFFICAGLPVAWYLGAPKYEATAVVFVSPQFVSTLGQGVEQQKFDSSTQYRDYVQQNVRTVNRFDIVLEGLNKVGGLKSFWVRPNETLERAAARLQGALMVEQVPDTYQITVSLRSAKKDGLAELVNAIVGIYLEKVKAEQFYASDERVASLMSDRDKVKEAIDKLQARRVELAQELGVTSFAESTLNPYDRLLISARESEAEARKNAIDAEAQVSALEDKERSGGGDALRASGIDLASKDPILASLMTNLNGRRSQILAVLSGLSSDHPGRKSLERELAEIEQEKQTAYQRQVDSFSNMLLVQRQADSFRAALVEKEMAAEVKRQESQAAAFTRGYQEGVQLGISIDQARKRYDAMEQRLDFFALEKGAPGFVRLFTSARRPDQPVKGGRKKVFAIFLLAGLVLALVTPAAVDVLDPRIHGTRDLEVTLGFPPIGWLMEKEEAGPEFAREQFLRLANRINQDQQSNNSRIFAFTSVKSGGGTSTVVTETAAAFGRLGIRALAVEANAYRADPRYPDLHPRGLTISITAQKSSDSKVTQGEGELSGRIPVGDIKGDKSVPDVTHLVETLRQAAAAYPVTLVDIPPILISADAEFIARSADVVVLVVEAESVTRTELARAAKTLERIKAQAVSVVLNRVRGFEEGGFGNAALEEFTTGKVKPPARWLSPWLWR
jgi:polysaccharide biosynthesis transport protein